MSKMRQEIFKTEPELDYLLNMRDITLSNDKKYFVLVIYDISEDRRRNKLVKILSSYGFRVQKSAFEAILRPNKYEQLLKEISTVPAATDSVRIYKIQGQGTVEVFGEPFSIPDEEIIII